MRDRIRIAKTALHEWTVSRPRIGFSGPEITPFTSWANAMNHVNLLLASTRWGGTETGVERPLVVHELWFPFDTIRT